MYPPTNDRLYWLEGAFRVEGWPMHFVLYATGVIQRFATLRYITYKGSKGVWELQLRDWPEYVNIEEAQICAPPKEYVESLVRLAYDVGVNDG